MGIILLIPVGFAVIALLGFVGLGLDFSNSWSNKSSGGASTNSMYIIALPLCFLIFIGWVLYTLGRRKSKTQEESQRTEIRKQVYNDLSMGDSKHDYVISILSQYGGLSSEELAYRLGIEHDEIMKVLSDLLQSGEIYQDIKDKPIKFYLTK